MRRAEAPRDGLPGWFRYARLVRLRWYMSAGPLFSLVASALSFVVRGQANVGNQPVVALGENLPVPLWPVVFGLAGLLLLCALLARRLLATAHALGATVCVGYGVALAAGSVLTQVGWTAASFVIGMGLVHLFFAAAYAKGR